MAKVINQIKYNDVEYAIAHSAYGYCETAAGTPGKVVAISTDGDTTNTAFTLIKGVSVTVKFKETNSAANPTLNVGGSGAKPIYYKGSAVPANYLKASRTYTFVYTTDVVSTGIWEVISDITAAVNSGPTLAWSTTSTVGTVDGVELKVTMPPNPNTDTHYTTGLYVGASGAKSNAATSNGYTYLKLYDDSTSRASFKISGSGATTVSSDASGNITISSTDTNTDTDTKVAQTALGSTTTDYYLLASSTSSPTSGSAYGAHYTSSIKLRGTGQLTATTFYANSDKRLKENIVEYVPKHSILELPVYKYNFIADKTKTTNIGCLAQDLREICPEIVDTDNTGYLSINESKIVYLLLDELKKVKAEMTRLNIEVEELKNKSN